MNKTMNVCLSQIANVINVPALSPFDPSPHFLVCAGNGTTSDTAVRIDDISYWVGEECLGQTEPSTTSTQLIVTDLLSDFAGPLGTSRCGGMDVITAGQLHWLLQLQGHGEPGHLHVDGREALFCLRGKSWKLLLVHAYWYGPSRGWRLYDGSIEYSSWWRRGGRIISPRPQMKSLHVQCD